jgi:hypothetical protein
MARLLVRWFLDLRRGAAALLAALAARIAPPVENPAMVVLRNRFPGAPEHWLAAIAARAPPLAMAAPARAEKQGALRVLTPEVKRSLEKRAFADHAAAAAATPLSAAFAPLRRPSIEREDGGPSPARVGRREVTPVSRPRLRLHSSELPPAAPEPPKRREPGRAAAVETKRPNAPGAIHPRPALDRRRVESWTEEIDRPRARLRATSPPGEKVAATRSQSPTTIDGILASPSQSHSPAQVGPLAPIHAARETRAAWRDGAKRIAEREVATPPASDALEDASGQWPELPPPADRAVPADTSLERERERERPNRLAAVERWEAWRHANLSEAQEAPAPVASNVPEAASGQWPELPPPADRAAPADAWRERERERERLARLARDQMERSWNA